MKKQCIKKRLLDIESRIPKQVINEKTSSVYACMTIEELRELAYKEPSQKRIDEIWERAVHEHKQRRIKTN